MIKSTSQEINQMTMIPNRVIVKLTRKEDELDLGSGKKIFIDPSFAREMHTPTVGIVANFSETLDHSKMPWRTHCEIQKGDYIVFSFEASINALQDDTSRLYIDEKQDLYIIIDFEDLFVAKRGTKVIPLNGYVLCKPYSKEEMKSSKIILPDFVRRKRSDKLATIAHIGTRCEEYYNADGSVRPDLYDPMYVGSVGDTVIIDKNCTLPIEYELHNTFGTRKEVFYRVRRCYIKANISKQ